MEGWGGERNFNTQGYPSAPPLQWNIGPGGCSSQGNGMIVHPQPPISAGMVGVGGVGSHMPGMVNSNYSVAQQYGTGGPAAPSIPPSFVNSTNYYQSSSTTVSTTFHGGNAQHFSGLHHQQNTVTQNLPQTNVANLNHLHCPCQANPDQQLEATFAKYRLALAICNARLVQTTQKAKRLGQFAKMLTSKNAQLKSRQAQLIQPEKVETMFRQIEDGVKGLLCKFVDWQKQRFGCDFIPSPPSSGTNPASAQDEASNIEASFEEMKKVIKKIEAAFEEGAKMEKIELWDFALDPPQSPWHAALTEMDQFWNEETSLEKAKNYDVPTPSSTVPRAPAKTPEEFNGTRQILNNDPAASASASFKGETDNQINGNKGLSVNDGLTVSPIWQPTPSHGMMGPPVASTKKERPIPPKLHRKDKITSKPKSSRRKENHVCIIEEKNCSGTVHRKKAVVSMKIAAQPREAFPYFCDRCGAQFSNKRVFGKHYKECRKRN